MRVYISGKITGDPNFFDKFKKWEKYLQEKGFATMNPAYNCMLMPLAEYEEYMELSFHELSMCDAIFMLPDWKMSSGARQENCYAYIHGIQIIEKSERENGGEIE